MYDRNRFAPVLFHFIFIRFQAVCFCSFRYAVDDRTGLRTGNCINHNPVLLSDTALRIDCSAALLSIGTSPSFRILSDISPD